MDTKRHNLTLLLQNIIQANVSDAIPQQLQIRGQPVVQKNVHNAQIMNKLTLLEIHVSVHRNFKEMQVVLANVLKDIFIQLPLRVPSVNVPYVQTYNINQF